MSARLERILQNLATLHAPTLLMRGWPHMAEPTLRLSGLARALAAYNLLVIVGDPATPSIDESITKIQAWVNGYATLYQLLARSLFPSFTELSADYADGELPVVMVIKGTATPVIEVMAGYVAPYIVKRQFQQTIYEAEVTGIMDAVLDELEAGDLPREAFRQLRSDGAAVIKRMMVNAPLRQLALTNFDRPMFTDTGRLSLPPNLMPPDSLPEQNRPAAPRNVADVRELHQGGGGMPPGLDTSTTMTPPTLPEDSDTVLRPDIEDTASRRVFDTGPLGRTGRRPPVPDLPEKK